MELRSNSRSRSRTPFVQSIQQTELFAEGSEYEETVVRTTRSSTIKSYESATGNTAATKTSLKSKVLKPERSLRRTTRHKTSDYSSEDGETEVTSSHVSENEKNQLIEDAKVAANGSSEISALGLYRKAGRYWDVYPKTDWTYSRSSRDRVELAPGVVAMPNMSRRSLHSQERSTDHLLTTTTNLPSNSVNYRGRSLFTDDNYNDEYEYSTSSSTYHHQKTETTLIRRFFWAFWAVYTTIVSGIYRTVEYQGAWWLWLGKRVHRAASLLFLWDAWLLRVWDGRRRSVSKVNGVLWLCLVPLLLFGGWYLTTTLGPAFLYGTNTNHTSTPHLQAEVSYSSNVPVDLTQEQLEKIALLLNNRDVNTEPLKEEIERIKIELKELENSKTEDINRLLAQIKTENLRVMHSLRQCCRNSLINIETYVTKAVKDIFNQPEFTKDREDLTVWLRSIFVAKDDLENHLNNATQNLKSDFDAAIKTSGEKIMDEVAGKISLQLKERVVVNTDSLSDEHIKNIVRDVLAVYDADKTGLVDFAMEPMGGQIITTKCTESYQARTAVVSILGVPLWYPTNTPRTVITPGLNPGECWAFQNFPGFLVIKLAAPIKISAFSYEHISKKLIANGRIDSAPKEFEVYGLKNETDKEPLLLGHFRYDFNGESLQFFASAHYDQVFEMIELRVLSNHGNPNYTCLYRFRVHGSVEPT